jgi:L-fuconolactonase
MVSPVVDSHHHFWNPSAADYPWMTSDYEVLRRPYGPSDLAPILEATGVDATVVVQARQELDETHSLLGTASETEWIVGVVGWVDLTDVNVSETISQIREGQNGDKLVGFRHVVHDEADPQWLLRDDVMRGLGVVAEAGLVYDLLVRTRELPAAIEVARRLPNLRLVLDHLAKPRIAEREIEPWSTSIGEIARLPNVTCKISGLVTEADWRAWAPDDLAPFIERAVEVFGPDRLMFGSDWPVCTLAASYSEMLDATFEVLSSTVGDDLASILGGAAIETYCLVLPSGDADPP